MATFITKKLQQVLQSKPELKKDSFFQALAKKYGTEDVVIGSYSFGDIVVKDGKIPQEDRPIAIRYSDIPLSFILDGYLEIYTSFEGDNINSNITAAVINSSNSFFGVFETCDLLSSLLHRKHIPIFKNFQIVAGVRNIFSTVPLTLRTIKKIPSLSLFDSQVPTPDTPLDCFDLIKSFSKTTEGKRYEILFFTEALIKAISYDASLKNYILLKGWEQSYNLRNDQYNINEIKNGLLQVESDTRSKVKTLNQAVINYIAALYVELLYVKKGIIPSLVPVSKINVGVNAPSDPISSFQKLLLDNKRHFPSYPCILIPWVLSHNCLSAVHPLHKNTTFAAFPEGEIGNGTDRLGQLNEVTKVIHQLQTLLDDKWKIAPLSCYTSISGKNRDMAHATYKGHFKLLVDSGDEVKIEFPDQHKIFREFALITF